MADQIAIRVENVSKDFVLPHEKTNSIKGIFTSAAKRRQNKGSETQHALKNISFEIKQGEFFGIVGRNGSGKSTLLKILAGIYQPTSGQTYTRGKLVPFIELGVGFDPELTGRENVYLNGAMLGFSEEEIAKLYDDIVSFAELERFMDQKLKNYSSGMQVRLAFSMAVRADAEILLIDEVLAVGDADFQRKCFEYFKRLKKNKKTVVFISHDMNAIREFCDRAALIDNSELQIVGETQKIAEQYSKLFITDAPNGPAGSSGERWGNKNIEISSAVARVSGEDVLVDVELNVNKNVEEAIYGLHIIAQDGAEITAMNNKMINMPSLHNLEKGQTIELQWKVLNVFNDGRYAIALTFIDELTNTLDWWVDATSFEVKRAERSTTAVFPPVKTSVRIKGK